MEVICLQNDVKNLTKNKRYDVIKMGNPATDHPKHFNWAKNWFLLINDLGQEDWFEQSPMGIIEVIDYTGEVIQYIGGPSEGLTNGKCYETLNKLNNEHFYFINDNGVFVGISKRNYFGGAYNFIEITKERDRKINQIITEE